MKKAIIFIIALLPVTSFGQMNGTWSVSSHFQKDMHFTPINTCGFGIMKCIEPMWYDRFHYTAGLGVNYRFENQFELSSGLRYSKKKEEFSGYPLECGNIDFCFIGIAPVTRRYVEMPVLARYYFLPGKIKMHVESGWIGSYRVDENYYNTEHDWLLSAQTGVGVNLFLNRWQFGLGANYRLQFDLTERNDIYSIQPHAFGIEFKTAFSLNK
ncbi:MAG: PorT family protein [bacterium]|nr:PorT family protein [bacterium]